MSRYYYSLFHHARWYGETHVAPRYDKEEAKLKDSGGSHKHLWLWLTRLTNNTVFTDLVHAEIHAVRCDADYDLVPDEHHPFDDDTFNHTWENIGKLHTLLEGLPKPWPINGADQSDPRREVAERVKSLWPPRPRRR